MEVFKDRLDLPYAQSQVFALVSDIEAYPRFIPHIAEARIVRRLGNRWEVHQVLRLNILRVPFTTFATVQPCESLHIEGSAPGFGRFTEDWRFAALSATSMRLTCTTRVETQNRLLGAMTKTAYGEIHHAALTAFKARAGALYAPHPPAAEAPLSG